MGQALTGSPAGPSRHEIADDFVASAKAFGVRDRRPSVSSADPSPSAAALSFSAQSGQVFGSFSAPKE